MKFRVDDLCQHWTVDFICIHLFWSKEDCFGFVKAPNPRNDRLTKKLSTHIRDESEFYNSRGTTLVLAIRASTSATWAITCTQMTIHVPQVTFGRFGVPTGDKSRSDCSSGRIFSLPFCPGSHPSRGRWQGSRLTRFHHRFWISIGGNYAIEEGIGQMGDETSN